MKTREHPFSTVVILEAFSHSSLFISFRSPASLPSAFRLCGKLLSSFCLFLLPLCQRHGRRYHHAAATWLKTWQLERGGPSSAEGCRFKFLGEQRGFLSYHVAIYRLERQRNQILWDSGGVNWVLGTNKDDIPFENDYLLNWNDFSLRWTRWGGKYFKYNCAALTYIYIFILNKNWHSGRWKLFLFLNILRRNFRVVKSLNFISTVLNSALLKILSNCLHFFLIELFSRSLSCTKQNLYPRNFYTIKFS